MKVYCKNCKYCNYDLKCNIVFSHYFDMSDINYKGKKVHKWINKDKFEKLIKSFIKDKEQYKRYLQILSANHLLMFDWLFKLKKYKCKFYKRKWWKFWIRSKINESN